MKSRLQADDKRAPPRHDPAMFIITLALAVMTALALALPLLRLMKQAMPVGGSPAPWIHGREIEGALTDSKVEELIREELYGQRLNVSRT